MTLPEFKEKSDDYKTLRANVPIVPGIMLLESLVKSAYLAGERAGLTRGEALCKKAIELAAIMRGEK